MCNRQFTKMLPLKPEIYEALLKQDELDRRQLRPKDYYSERKYLILVDNTYPSKFAPLWLLARFFYHYK